MTTTSSSRFEHFGFGVPWEDAASYSQATRAGNLLFVSGQLSHDPDGTFLHAGDFKAQAAATLDNLDRVLAEFKAQRSDIVEINVFLIDLRANFDAAVAGTKRYFEPHRGKQRLRGGGSGLPRATHRDRGHGRPPGRLIGPMTRPDGAAPPVISSHIHAGWQRPHTKPNGRRP